MILLCIYQVTRSQLTHWGLTTNLQARSSVWRVPNDAICRQGSGSTLAQVMACCLTAPSHYLNQCWLIIRKVQWYSSEDNYTSDTSAINPWNKLENYLYKIPLKSARGQWVNCCILQIIWSYWKINIQSHIWFTKNHGVFFFFFFFLGGGGLVGVEGGEVGVSQVRGLLSDFHSDTVTMKIIAKSLYGSPNYYFYCSSYVIWFLHAPIWLFKT